jgi:hypothetical protein
MKKARLGLRKGFKEGVEMDDMLITSAGCLRVCD